MSDTQSAPCGVGGSGFVRRLIDHPTIPDELRGEVARILDNLGIANAYIDELEARLATLEAENKRLAARVAELEAENKDLRNRAELADGDVKRAQAILDASNTYIRRIEVDLQRESQAKIDAEFHVAALKERVAEMENVKRKMGGAR